VNLLDLLVTLLLLAIAVNVLAILLRVSCHFCGVEIPTYGRAVFTVVATWGLSLLVAILIQSDFVGGESSSRSSVPQLVALVLELIVSASITIAAYVPLLRVRTGQAVKVWLAQALVFICLAMLLGCCMGVSSLL
jgi:hypothetical protein